MAIKKTDIISGKDLGAQIKGYKSDVKTFKAREHVLAVSCIAYFEEHGRINNLVSLLNACPPNYRLGLIRWAEAFAPVKYNRETRSLEIDKNKKKKTDAFKLDAAMQIAPADYIKSVSKGASAPKAFDPIKTAERLFDKCVAEGVDEIFRANLNQAIEDLKARLAAKKEKAEVTEITERQAALNEAKKIAASKAKKPATTTVKKPAGKVLPVAKEEAATEAVAA